MYHNLLNLCYLTISTSAGGARPIIWQAFSVERNSVRDSLMPFVFFFYVWVWWSWVPPPTWHNPLTNCQCLSLWSCRHVWQFTSCLTHKKKIKMCWSRLAAPGILAHDLVVEGWTLKYQDSPVRWGLGSYKGVSFLVPHIQLSASSLSSLCHSYPAFILLKVAVSITHKCNMANPFWIGAKVSCEAFKVKCFQPSHVCSNRWQQHTHTSWQ